MSAILILFLALAGLGFIASVVVHFLARAGILLPGGVAVFGLHIGVFVVWLPAVLVLIRVGRGERRRASWKQVLMGFPMWVRYAAIGFFAYAFINFFIAFGASSGAQAAGGAISPAIIRGFSGHWMLFYGIAFAILYSAYRNPWLLSTVRCSAGHKVAHDDNFCPTCSKSLPASRASD